MLKTLSCQLVSLGTLYDENAMFIPGKDQKPIVGREKIKEALKPYLASPGKVGKISESIYENGDTALIKLEWCLTTEKGETIEPKFPNNYTYEIGSTPSF